MIDNTISDIYSSVFGITYRNKKIMFDNKIISTNIEAIIEFLGLCYKEYLKGFSNVRQFYNFIKKSHYFNIDYIKDKNLKTLSKTDNHLKRFDYQRYFDNRFIMIKKVKRFFKKYE